MNPTSHVMTCKIAAIVRAKPNQEKFAMIVVDHRPPLKRVDFAIKPRVVEPETASEGTRALREIGEHIENDRIWGHVRRTAEGCNPVGEVGQ